MWIIKIGGSLSGNPSLKEWLDVLAGSHSKQGVVIVPGGGRFADTVRDAQQRWGFNDELAHCMALRAMEQYGMMLSGINPHLITTDDPGTIQNALSYGRVPVWMPYKMVHTRADIPRDWNMTSDSLAAWLAQVMCAEKLLLIKSVVLDSGRMDIHKLADMDVVDRYFPAMLTNQTYSTYIFQADRPVDFQFHQTSPEASGLRVTGYY